MIRQFLLMLLVVMAISQSRMIVCADDELDYAADALRAANDIEWSKMSVRILNPEGDPVNGATIRPWALRAGNGHGGWNAEQIGAPVTTRTDVAGVAEVVYPQSLDWGSGGDRQPVTQVSVFLSHPDFCTENIHVNVPDKDPLFVTELRLKRGTRLRVAGVAQGSNLPLSDCHVLLEGALGKEDFVSGADGWLQSVPLSQDRRWFRVVRAVPGEPPQFSRPQAWSPDDPASREVRVEVRPGVRVIGKISDAVPRPITNGVVVVWCGSPIRREPEENGPIHRSSWWIDTVPIAENGSFEFASLPSGYMAQFFAMANDWISSSPSNESFESCLKWFSDEKHHRVESFRYGQTLRLSTGKAQIALEMEIAGSMRVTCVDQDGHPLSRISVSSWPNQYMVGAGSTVFCMRQSSLDRLLGKTEINWEIDNPFSAKTDSDGVAVIRNLPPGNESVIAGNSAWKPQTQNLIKIEPEKTTDITLTLERAR